jgi:hypothetical protein
MTFDVLRQDLLHRIDVHALTVTSGALAYSV